MSDASTPAPAAPSPQATAVKSFVRSLLDVKFETFVTRKIATVFYIVGLVLILLGGLIAFFVQIAAGINLLRFGTAGIIPILIALIVVPIATFVSVLLFRVMIEMTIAIIVIAENTRPTKK